MTLVHLWACRFFFKEGCNICNKGAQCEFSHSKQHAPKPKAKAKAAAAREDSPSKDKKSIACKFHIEGKCTKGDKCPLLTFEAQMRCGEESEVPGSSCMRQVCDGAGGEALCRGLKA